MSAGSCPRCGGDGRIPGRHLQVGHYLMVCALCRGTGNYPPDPEDRLGAAVAALRVAWLRLYVVVVYRPISRMVRRFGDALDRLGVDE